MGGSKRRAMRDKVRKSREKKKKKKEKNSFRV